ncbi:3-oxoacyl-ACP reductase [Euzebya sp.]|uniref:3-oxoacyl-ACP reductase n=1 Tax=Euzebya sp. TaxID=1971409 RepID=UPI003518CB0F
MADLYTQFVNSQVGERIAGALGLPKPAALRRYEPGQPLLDGPLLLGGDGRLADTVAKLLDAAGVEVHRTPADAEQTPRYAALVFDATHITRSADLDALHGFFHTTIRRLGPSARVVVLGTVPDATGDPAEHAAQRSLEGFVRSIAKELRAGGTANLVEVVPGADAGVGGPLRFLLSGRSAYVSGQRITVGPSTDHPPVVPADANRPLDGKVAVVTGAARGIGAAIARTLARDGAHVVCLDLPSAGDALAAVANGIGGSALQLDITDDDAGQELIDHVRSRHGGLDIMVNNAGITRDKTVAGMDERRWDQVIAVNLTAMEALDAALLASDVLRPGARIVCVSSMSGIAGNRGQTNYAASKAGVIGHVAALAPRLAESGGTINAVAPGFIETDMTDAMPMATREIGRRLNSLSQGGQPVDVAEAIGFFAGSDATWVNGTTLRVCGQNLLGA